MIKRIKRWFEERNWMAACDRAAANPKSYNDDEGVTVLRGHRYPGLP